MRFVDMCLDEVNLGGAKIFACTTDTTLNINLFGMKLEDEDSAHIYCTDHCYSSPASIASYTDTDKTFGEQYAASIKKAKALVDFFCKSTKATEKLLRKQEILESCKGTPKRLLYMMW